MDVIIDFMMHIRIHAKLIDKHLSQVNESKFINLRRKFINIANNKVGKRNEHFCSTIAAFSSIHGIKKSR
jgi:hypothetical protein